MLVGILEQRFVFLRALRDLRGDLLILSRKRVVIEYPYDNDNDNDNEQSLRALFLVPALPG